MSRKKIVFIPGETYPIPPVNGGAVESLIYSLIVENEIRQEYDFVVYSKYDEEAERASKNLKYTCVRYVKNAHLGYKIKYFLRGVLNRFLGRIAYFGNSYIETIFKDSCSKDAFAVVVENVPIYAISVRKYTRAKIYLHCHNLYSCSRFPYLNQRVFESTDCFWGISDFVCKDILARSKEFCQNSIKVETFYNCYDANNALYDSRVCVNSEILNRYRIPHGKKMFVFAGRIQPYKGVKELLTAFMNVKRDDCVLVVVGGTFFKNSPDDDYVRELKEMAFLRKDVFFTGYVSHDDLLSLYRNAYAAVVPSLWEEPFALTCLEPMACSIPVIISDAGGMPEVVDGMSSIVVKRCADFIEGLTKAIQDISENVALRNEMGLAAKKRSENFSSKKYYARFGELVNI